MTDPHPGGPADPWPPTSGAAPTPAYPPQVSAVPASSPVYPVPVAMPVPAKTTPWVWVLAALSFVLLLGVGSVGALYVSTSSDNDKRVQQRSDTIEQLTNQSKDLDSTKSGLEKQVSDAKGDVDQAQKSLDALLKCQDAIVAFGTANQAATDGTGTRAAADAAFNALAVACGSH